MADAIDRLAVSIAFLGRLTNVPGKSAVNVLGEGGEWQEPQGGRSISFKHEMIVVQQLAFICAYSDDPLHVLAICIEECKLGEGIIVRLAANSGTHQALLDGLRAVVDILQAEARDIHRSTNQDSLFRAIVSLNRMRILSRFRSRHAASRLTRTKAPLMRRLKTVKTLLPVTSTRAATTTTLHNKIDVVLNQFEHLERMETSEVRSGRFDDLLLCLVTDIQRLLTDHGADLSLIPYTPGIWSGDATISFLDRLRKPAQYAVACTELLRVARRYDAFSKIEIDFLSLQQSGPRLSARWVSNVDQLIQTVSSRGTLSQASRHCRMPANRVLDAVRSQLLGTSRLHAEVQIVLFYEQNASELRPRVICSSKSACYLCYLFFKLHGKYYVPSTHGRLYETWRWPMPTTILGDNDAQTVRPTLEGLLPTFINSINTKIQQCLRQPTAVKSKDPLESQVEFFGTLTPSIASADTALTNHTNIHSRSSPCLNDIVSRPSTTPNCQLAVPGSPRLPSKISSEIESVGATESSTDMTKSSLESQSTTASSRGPRDTQVTTLNWKNDSSIRYRFKNGDRLLQIRWPGLKVDILHILSPKRDNGGPTTDSLEVDIEYFHSSADYSIAPSGYIVNLGDGDWVEQTLPQGVATTEGGMLLKKGSAFLRIRTVPEG